MWIAPKRTTGIKPKKKLCRKKALPMTNEERLAQLKGQDKVQGKLF